MILKKRSIFISVVAVGIFLVVLGVTSRLVSAHFIVGFGGTAGYVHYATPTYPGGDGFRYLNTVCTVAGRPANEFKVNGRCANEGYFRGGNSQVGIFNAQWIWPSGNEQISADYGGLILSGPNAGKYQGFITQMFSDLLSFDAIAALAYLDTGVCTLPALAPGANPDFPISIYPAGPTALQHCQGQVGQLLGTSYIVNGMLGIDGATDPSFANPSVIPGCPYGPNSDRRVNGINVAKCRFAEWGAVVSQYASRPLGDPRGSVNWDLPINYNDGDYRSDMVVFLYNPQSSGIYDMSKMDVGSYINDGNNSIDRYIRFYNPDPDGAGPIQPTFFTINKKCGNIVGPTNALELTHDFTVTGNVTAPVLTPQDEDSPTSVDFGNALTSAWDAIVDYPPANLGVFEKYFVKRPNGDEDIFNGGTAGEQKLYTNLFTLAAPSLTRAGFTANFSDLAGGKPPPRPGDEVCIRITIAPGSGTTGPLGNIIPPFQPAYVKESCTLVALKPYLSIYGGDIFAGVSANCPGWTGATAGVGDVRAFLNTATNNGTATQFAAMALGTINDTEIHSASLRTAPPQRSRGLTFANTSAPYGNLGVNHCPTDYWGAGPPAGTPNLPTVPAKDSPGYLRAIPSNTYKNSGNLHLGYNDVFIFLDYRIQSGKHLVIYVNGDLELDDSIVFDTTVPWPTPNDVPSITFIVKGNIYIDNSVKRLDGTYIAQPDVGAGTEGIIYTCTDDDDLFDPASDEIKDNCDNQLVVNGSLIARQVKWLRSHGSIRDDYVAGPPLDCTNSGGATPNTTDCAAEIINFNPESYIVTPSAINTGNTSVKYDYFTALPPLL